MLELSAARNRATSIFLTPVVLIFSGTGMLTVPFPAPARAGSAAAQHRSRRAANTVRSLPAFPPRPRRSRPSAIVRLPRCVRREVIGSRAVESRDAATAGRAGGGRSGRRLGRRRGRRFLPPGRPAVTGVGGVEEGVNLTDLL